MFFVKIQTMVKNRINTTLDRHPEVLVRVVLILGCTTLPRSGTPAPTVSENIAFRWFCFLTLDDGVFDHSTITCFIERIGREGFKVLFDGFNQELFVWVYFPLRCMPTQL